VAKLQRRIITEQTTLTTTFNFGKTVYNKYNKSENLFPKIFFPAVALAFKPYFSQWPIQPIVRCSRR